MSNPWWKRLPGRLLEEEQALLSLRGGELPIVRTHRWTREPDGEPRVRAMLVFGAGSFEVEVRFPWHYPEGCPSVRPIPYDRPVSSHQFIRSGVFCLELGPDNWHPRYTAAGALLSAWRLLMQEIIASEVPFEIQSRHVSDLADRVRHGGGVLLRSSAFDNCLATAETLTAFEAVWPARNLVRVFPVAFPKGTPLPDAMLAHNRESRLPGLFVPLAVAAPGEAPKGLPEFDDFVATYASTLPEQGAALLIVLKWANGTTRGFLRFANSVLHLVDVPLDVAAGSRTPGTLATLLSSVKIGIVGLGSLGSKVAVSLARTGASRFVLVDGEVFEGANVCRHAGSLPDIGAFKVDVVKELIRDVCPAEPEIICHAIDLTAPTNPELHAQIMKDLGEADIVVDATANPEVFGLLAMIASDKRHSMVWGEVFGGGIGGLVGSAHPDHGPCPRCVRAGFAAGTQSWPAAPAVDGSKPYDGGEDAPFVATDADVGLIASAMTNRVFDLEMEQYQGLPAVMVVGLKRGWIFDAPIQSVPVHVRADDWSCSRCWTSACEPDAGTEAQAESLFHADDNAHDSPTI